MKVNFNFGNLNIESKDFNINASDFNIGVEYEPEETKAIVDVVNKFVANEKFATKSISTKNITVENIKDSIFESLKKYDSYRDDCTSSTPAVVDKREV